MFWRTVLQLERSESGKERQEYEEEIKRLKKFQLIFIYFRN